jgi:uroporphyrinogen decarboxylase
MLRDCEIAVDVEPEHPKMGPLLMAAAEKAGDILQRKRRTSIVAQGASDPLDKTAPWYDSPFLKACRREPVPYTPVWLMRQAGRYMKEYREVRGKTTFLDLCKNPQLCSEVMCTAVNRLGVDAAIIFSDLLPILEPMGLDLEFAHGEGPVIHNPIREASEVSRLIELENMDELSFVMETVRQTRRDLPGHIPLIGFAGAPFTLASYAIEGGSSRSYLFTKTLMLRNEPAWRDLMDRLARSVARYLNAQIAAGAQAVQIFDSWVGCLSADDYRRYVLPSMKLMLGAITPGAPVINFATGNPELLPLLSEAGGDVIGLDWRVRLDDGWKRVGYDRAVQGNLDPAVLLADSTTIRERVQDVLQQAGNRPGHIFNLGHGVLQQTPVENAIEVVKAVHELSAR